MEAFSFLNQPPAVGSNRSVAFPLLVSRTRPPDLVPRTHGIYSEKDPFMSQYKFGAAWPLAIVALIAVVAGFSTQAQYATAVVNYTPGSGYATEFGTGLGYTLTDSVLGEPSRIIPGTFGGPVDPFNAPYLREQLLSLGTGGSVTVALAAENAPGNPYGLDFQIFGNTFFQISNGDYSGGGITDGSSFGANTGLTRVSVSADGSTFYQLNPLLAPLADGLFPTQGNGDFHVPVNPALKSIDFNGLDLTGIGLKYNLSGGGTGYDISWALNSSGQAVPLDHINYVRVDVLNGRSDIDALAAVRSVPEPSTGALLGLGVVGLISAGHRRRQP